MNRHSLSEQEFLQEATKKTEANLANPGFGVSELAREMGMSRSNLHRKIHKSAGVSVSQFIRNIRLKKAKQLLQKTSLTISEIGWEVGFNDISYFIKCFREYYGQTPGEIGDREEEFTQEQTEKSKRFPSINKNWYGKIIFIAALAIFALVLVKFIDFNKLSSGNESITEDASPYLRIAILPFKNDSQDTINAYFINGLMEAILLNLSNDKDLSVRSRTSVEKYRFTQLSVPEIAEELGVDYIIEGSGQKYGDLVVLNIQLIEASTDQHVFSRKYQKKIEEVSDFISLQEEIALHLFAQIKDYVDSDKIISIANRFSDNYEAFNYYLLAQEMANQNIQPMPNEIIIPRYFKMRNLLQKALDLDPSFTLALKGLGNIYIQLNYIVEGSHSYLDSALYYLLRAVKVDPEYDELYVKMGNLYKVKGMYSAALEQYGIACEKDPKLKPFNEMGDTYFKMGEYCKSIEYIYRVINDNLENNVPVSPWQINKLENKLIRMGFTDQASKYSRWLLEKTNDSLLYYNYLIRNYLYSGELDSAVLILKQHPALDTVVTWNWYIPTVYIYLKEYEKAATLIKNTTQRIYPDHPNMPLAMYYISVGERKKAESILKYSIEHFGAFMKRLPTAADDQRLRIAKAYSLLEDKRSALDVLGKITQYHLGFQKNLKYNPMFDPIRNEPEFIEILAKMEEKYRVERERTRKLLVELGEI